MSDDEKDKNGAPLMNSTRFYIAASLAQAPTVSQLSALLVAKGMVHTFDWTRYGTRGLAGAGWPQVALAEIEGVATADFVVALSSQGAGRGTHCEIGAALALGKPVALFAESEEALSKDGYTCVFYSHPLVERCFISEPDPALIARVVEDFALRRRRGRR